MKVLEILNKLKNKMLNFTSKDVEEAIAELEAVQQSKGCKGCKYDFILNKVGDKVYICYMCSRQKRLDIYEPQE